MPNYSVEAKGTMSATAFGYEDAVRETIDTSAGTISLYLNNIVGAKGHATATAKREDTGATLVTISCKGGEAVSSTPFSTWGAAVASGVNILVEWSFGGVMPSPGSQVFFYNNGDLTHAGASVVGNGHVAGQARFLRP